MIGKNDPFLFGRSIFRGELLVLGSGYSNQKWYPFTWMENLLVVQLFDQFGPPFGHCIHRGWQFSGFMEWSKYMAITAPKRWVNTGLM